MFYSASIHISHTRAFSPFSPSSARAVQGLAGNVRWSCCCTSTCSSLSLSLSLSLATFFSKRNYFPLHFPPCLLLPLFLLATIVFAKPPILALSPCAARSLEHKWGQTGGKREKSLFKTRGAPQQKKTKEGGERRTRGSLCGSQGRPSCLRQICLKSTCETESLSKRRLRRFFPSLLDGREEGS